MRASLPAQSSRRSSANRSRLHALLMKCEVSDGRRSWAMVLQQEVAGWGEGKKNRKREKRRRTREGARDGSRRVGRHSIILQLWFTGMALFFFWFITQTHNRDVCMVQDTKRWLKSTHTHTPTHPHLVYQTNKHTYCVSVSHFILSVILSIAFIHAFAGKKTERIFARFCLYIVSVCVEEKGVWDCDSDIIEHCCLMLRWWEGEKSW